MKLLDVLSKGITNFGVFLFSYFVQIFKELWGKTIYLDTKEIVHDFIAVVRSTGMFGVLNIIALLVFTVLPQGKDIFLIIAEEVGVQKRFGNLIFLLVSIVLWSIVSEFGARYAIYVTDNSGKSVSAERVEWRKALQKVMADTFLLLPYLIVLIGFLINYLEDDSLEGIKKNLGFGIPALCVYLIFNVIAHFYYDIDKRNKWRNNPPNEFIRFLLLPRHEQDWCDKLYGIYNDYVFNIRKPTNFNGTSHQMLLTWWQWLTTSEKFQEEFPKNPAEVNEDSRVPNAFRLRKLDKEAGKGEGQFRWIYTIPLRFYKTLHKQLRVIVITCLVLFLAIALLPVSAYDNIGAPGLLVLAFACFSGIYLGLLYMDYALLRNSKWSLRVSLFALLLFSSVFNDDHQVRQNQAGYYHDARPDLKTHFKNWFDEYKKDSNIRYCRVGDSTPFYPVVFVCAEGGALRTGAYASALLSCLHDSFARSKQYNPINFKKSIYAFSGVSGGSLGISFFNAMAYLTDKNDLRWDSTYSHLTRVFFNEDYLAPVIGKMFYGDIINALLPFTIEKFDRAVALEHAWEEGFGKTVKKYSRNYFSADYLNLYKTDHTYPAMFINTAEVETGRQCWLSNVKPDSSMLLYEKRDLFATRLKGGINYSTMTNFSSRFPLFSPAAAIKDNEGTKYHYADGGYVENTGTGTMLEVLKVLKPLMDSLNIRPFVLVISYGESNNSAASNINFANEASEILYGIYNTRSGRSEAALEEMKRFIKSDTTGRGEVLVLPLQKTGSEVPMNWVLSKRSLENIRSDIKLKWENSKDNDLRKFFAIDSLCIPKCKWKIK